MSFVGRWVFHSIGTINDDCEMVYMSAEEYLGSPMPYIDEDDEEAVADELKERKQTISSQIDVCDDGKLYMLLPLPEGVSKEEVDAAVAAGEISLHKGMMTDKPYNWEDRNGELWIEVGMDMSEDGWARIADNYDLISFMTTRYVKE